MRARWAKLTTMAALLTGAASAQVRQVDPDRALNGDLAGAPPRQLPAPRATYTPVPPEDAPADAQPPQIPSAPPPNEQSADATTRSSETFGREDLLSAGEGVFGKGAQGFAGIIEKILKGQGRPNAYIAGHEAAGAFIVGLRYGSGVMTHKVEGQMPVYWTGPSIGFDVGGDATKVFVLVYNLYDTADLYHRFPAAEGRLYAIGGFAATYLRRGRVVLIPVRLGVGWRAGVNVGYMKFRHKNNWVPL